MATKYEGLTTAQWANRIVDYNPGKFDKSALIKHYTAQQLGKFQEGGNIQLAKALKGAKTPAKGKKDDAIKFFKSIKKTPSAPARSGKALEIEKFLRQVAAENGIKINFDACPGVRVGSRRLPRRRSLLMTTCTRMIRIWRVVMRMMSSVVV